MIKSIIGQITRPSSLYEYHGDYWVESFGMTLGAYCFEYQKVEQNIFGVWVARETHLGTDVRMQKVPYKPDNLLLISAIAFTLAMLFIYVAFAGEMPGWGL